MYTIHFVLILVLSYMVVSEPPCSTCTMTTKICQCFAPDVQQLRSQLLEPKCSLQWEELRIYAPSLKRLSVNDFTNTQCKKLRTLEIAGGDQDFVAIEQGVFKDLADLRHLVLTLPRLNRFAPGLFNDVSGLESLVINKTRVEMLQLGHLQGLHRVVSLTLQNNYINKLQVGVFNDTPRLQNLVVVGNKQISLANQTFQGLFQLRELTLTELFRIEPNAFAPLRQSLVKLDIRATKVIFMNRIWSDLSQVFSGLEKLQVLRLMDTRVMSSQLAEGALSSLTALRELDLQGNIFPEVSRQLLTSLTSLRKLSLRDCKIKCVYNRNFDRLRQLQVLDLSHNLLTFLPRYLLSGLEQLSEIHLAANPLIHVQAGTFCGLHRLLLSSHAVNQIQNQLNDTYQGVNITESCPIDVQPDRLQIDAQCYRWPMELNENWSLASNMSGVVTAAAAINHSQDEYFFLLIIVAVCVIFLLAAFGLIISYRAWSQRKNKQLLNEQEAPEAKEMLPVTAVNAAIFENRVAAKQPQHHHHHHHQSQRPTSSLIAAAAVRESAAQGKQSVAQGSDSTMSSSQTVSSLLTPGHQIRSDVDGTVITTLAVI